MVTGNGLLAKAFAHFAAADDVLIFASGVSNSQETDAGAFERERNLLLACRPTPALLVYFSTISVYDPSLSHSRYIIHKRETEALIAATFPCYLVFRLPILVGRSENPHTLTNYLFHAIGEGLTIPVYQHACRYLMDVDDVSLVLSEMIRSHEYDNCMLDVNFNNAVTVNRLLDAFEEVTGIKAKRSPVERGACYQTANETFLDFCSKKKITSLTTDVKVLLTKYYGSR